MNLFEHGDQKDRKRAGKKLSELAAEQQAELNAEQQAERDSHHQSIEKFAREANRQQVEAMWKHRNVDPVVSAGIMLTPELVEYGRNIKAQMTKHVVESAIRDCQESGTCQSQAECSRRNRCLRSQTKTSSMRSSAKSANGNTSTLGS